MKLIILLFVLLSMIIISSCTDKIVSECDEDLTTGASTFSSIQAEIFDKHCATSGCHAGNQPAGALLLTGDNVYNNLVGKSSNQVSMNLVEPGDSKNSYLIKKLLGEGTSLMPPLGKLPDDYINNVSEWIDNGANND